MLALLAALVLHAEPTPCRGRDEKGESFTTCFDPWSGLELGGGGGVDSSGGVAGFQVAVRYRGERDSRSKTDATWLTAQRFAAYEYAPVEGRTAFTLAGWEALFRHHVREGTLTVPTSPPTQLPFPFDVALYGSAVRWQRRFVEGNDWAMELARVALLLDVLRSPSGRFHLAAGPTAAWRLRELEGTLRHDVTPLTAGLVLANVESEDGLWVLRAQGVAGWSIDPLSSRAAVLRARGELQLERVLLAINDEPVSVFVRASGAFQDAGARATTEWTGMAGLLVRLFSDT